MRATDTTLSYVNLEALDLDPYPVFDRLRREAPAYWYADADAYLLTAWDDCERVVRDHDAFRGPAARRTAMRAFGDPTVLSLDGAPHKDLRKGIDPPLRPKQVNSYIDGMIRPVVRARIDELRDVRETEIMASFFEPVSVRALGDLLGLHHVKSDTLRSWFFGIVSGLVNEAMTDEGFEASDRAGEEIRQILTPEIERLTAAPDSSALSRMVWGGREADDPRSPEELMPTLRVYLAGGMQEPGHGAGSTLLGLFSRPDQLARVVADADLIPRAIVEGLRWIAPIGSTQREARVPTEVGGTVLEPGRVINVLLGAANRDPARYDDPHAFDLDRPKPQHLAFGGGDHFCAGHAFGRAVQRIAFEELFAAFPNIRQDPDREAVVRGWLFRAPRELHVLLR